MVKSLADELSDILDWVENPGLGEHARQEDKTGLVIFCRGLVCGLRNVERMTGETPISVDEASLDSFKPDWKRAEEKRRADEAIQRKEYHNKCQQVSDQDIQLSDVSVSTIIDSRPIREHS